jgi:hypothetical protein
MQKVFGHLNFGRLRNMHGFSDKTTYDRTCDSLFEHYSSEEHSIAVSTFVCNLCDNETCCGPKRNSINVELTYQ